MPDAQRREQLLDGALQIIVEQGYHALSIEAIAQQAGVTRPVVYRVFDGLDELLNALLDRQEARALDQLLARIALDPDLAQLDAFVRRAVTDLVAMVTGDPLTWRPILLAFAHTPPAVRHRIDRDRELVRQRFETVIRLVLASGRASSGVDATIVSHALLATAERFGAMILSDPDAIDVDALASTLAALVGGVKR